MKSKCMLLFLIGGCVVILSSNLESVAQERSNQLAAIQQRSQRIKELRQRDEIALRSKIHPDVRQKLSNGENVRVIVHLNVPLKRNTNPTSADDLGNKNLINTAQGELLSLLRERKHKVLRRYDSFPLISLEIGGDALSVIESSSLVLRVRESRMNSLALDQSVPMIGAPQVWPAPTNITGSGWTIGIIDTGISHTHPFLQDNNTTIVVSDEACYSVTQDCPGGVSSLTGQNQNAAVPCTFATGGCRHGTKVAGVVASRDSTYTGVAPGANILAVNVASNATGAACNNDPYNDNPCVKIADDDIIAGLNWIYSMRNTYSIAAVNISIQSELFADQQACDSVYSDYKEAIDRLRDANIATVIASGNNSEPFSVASPACVSSAVSVGATTGSESGEGVALFSNSAPFLSLLAPGDGIITSGPETSPFYTNPPVSGTSFAAPHVAGAWALMKQKNSSATVPQILNALQTTGKKITDARSGALNQVNCRIQIDQAINNIPDQTVIIDEANIIHGINNCGQIVGGEYVNWMGVLTDTTGTSTTSIVYNGSVESGGGVWEVEAVGINNKGEISGWWCCGYYGDRGFTRDISSNDSPDTWDCTTNDTYGDNDLGETVGLVGTFTSGASCSGVGFVKDVNGTYQSFTDDTPMDINNVSRIAGYRLDRSGYPYVFHGFYYDGSGRHDFDYPGAANTEVNGINESGQIVGCHWGESRYTDGQGFVRNADGTLRTITVTGADGNCATGINDSGQVVGYAWGPDGWWGQYGFVDLSW